MVRLYSYAMDGLSADKMKVLLHPSYDKKKEKVEDGDEEHHYKIKEDKESFQEDVVGA